MKIKPVLVPDHNAATLRKLMDAFADASTSPTRQELTESRAAVAAAQGVAEGSLKEFASGGEGGNGPFDYGGAIVQIGQDYTETFNDDGDGADAARIIRVGKTFMSKGMSAGIKAFYAMDTFVRDHVAEELSDQGFNVKQDIYTPYKQQMAKTSADVKAKTDKWMTSPEYSARKADELKISAIPNKPIDSWSKPGDPAASVSMDNASKRNVKAEFEKFKQDVAQRNSLKGVPLKFVVTVGGKPVDIDKLSGQGVAEGLNEAGRRQPGQPKFTAYPSYHAWRLELMRRGDDQIDHLDNDYVDNYRVLFAVDRNRRVVGMYYRTADTGTFVPPGQGFSDMIYYADTDPHWPYSDDDGKEDLR